MQERRKLKRRHTIRYMKVFDNSTDRLAGRIVDITTDGMMLISEETIETGKTFRLRLDLPETVGDINQITVDASSIWCNHDVNFDFYDTGFKFLNLSSENVEKLKNPLQRYLFKD